MKAQRLLRLWFIVAKQNLTGTTEVDILTWCCFCRNEECKNYGSYRLVPRPQIEADEVRQCVMDKIEYEELSKNWNCEDETYVVMKNVGYWRCQKYTTKPVLININCHLDEM